MALMQLRRLVLPAPFGPISANRSPLHTFKETSLRIFSPPMDKATASTRKSIDLSIPPSCPPVLFDIAVARSRFPVTLPQIELLNVLVIQERLRAQIGRASCRER